MDTEGAERREGRRKGGRNEEKSEQTRRDLVVEGVFLPPSQPSLPPSLLTGVRVSLLLA